MNNAEPIITSDARPLLESQVVEVLGRHELVAALMRARLEVALPVRDEGVDLVAYAAIGTKVPRFVARPIQLKASSTAAFSLDRKYERFPDLLIAYVWYVDDPKEIEIYAMTYDEAVAVAGACGWLTSNSWTEKGKWTVTRPSAKLQHLLLPYRMTSEGWWSKITGLIPVAPSAA